MILIVTGSHTSGNKADVFACLDYFHADTPVTFASLGDAEFIDTFAREWAESRHVRGVMHRAHWKRLGKAAGPERNGRMVARALAESKRTGEPITCIRFPGTLGTENCARQAAKAGIRVLRSDLIGPGDHPDDNEPPVRDWGDL